MPAVSCAEPGLQRSGAGRQLAEAAPQLAAAAGELADAARELRVAVLELADARRKLPPRPWQLPSVPVRGADWLTAAAMPAAPGRRCRAAVLSPLEMLTPSRRCARAAAPTAAP